MFHDQLILMLLASGSAVATQLQSGRIGECQPAQNALVTEQLQSSEPPLPLTSAQILCAGSSVDEQLPWEELAKQKKNELDWGDELTERTGYVKYNYKIKKNSFEILIMHTPRKVWS